MRVFSEKLSLKCREKRIRDMMCGSSHGRITNSKWGFLERLHRRIVAEIAAREHLEESGVRTHERL